MEDILIKIHIGAVILSYFTGLIVFVKPKGGKNHKNIGKIYAVSMLIGSLVTFGMYSFSGGFNIFHFFAIVTITSVSAGWYSIVKYVKTRKSKWLVKHYFNMAYSFMGLNLAAIAQMSRSLEFDTLMAYFTFTLILYVPAVLIARWLISEKLVPDMVKLHLS